MHHFAALLEEERSVERRFRDEYARATSLEERVSILEENLGRTHRMLLSLLERLEIRLDEEIDDDDHMESRIL